MDSSSSENAKEMEELTSWIFSSEEAVEVIMQLRSTLLNDLRVKGELERFANCAKATFSVVVEWILSQVLYSSARII